MKCPPHSEGESDDYNPTADFAASIDECYRAIRARVAAGGPGWGGWPAGVHADAGGQGIAQQPRPRPDSFPALAVEDCAAPVPPPLHEPAGDLMKYPFMPLFLGDLLADTLHLSTQEFGAYMFLILHAWKHDAKVDSREARQIARVSKFQWPKISSKISQFFDTTTVSNIWIHLRVKNELEKVAEVSEKRRDAAMQMHAKHHAKASHPHLQPLIESSSNGKGREAMPVQKPVDYRDPGNDYRSPPRTKSDTPLQPLPVKLR
jgi:uncharacterized protein YdaU (DUF1376 family)